MNQSLDTATPLSETKSADARWFDVVIVGAGPAGLSAALVLGRMQRSVLLLDTDAPAHAVSDGVHGFLAQDGTPPSALRAIGREQLQPYSSVELRPLAARLAHRLAGGGFELALEDATRVAARRLLLAHGMRYDVPDLRGAAELWGKRVFHCPYCHGWEVRDKRVAVYGCSDRAVHQALLLSSLTDDIVLLCDQVDVLSPDLVAHLASVGIRAEPRLAIELYEQNGALQVALKDAPTLARDAIFIQPKLSLASDLAASLGAELNETGTVATDAAGLSTVPNLYAAGDAATAVQSVAVATGTGARAAYAINGELATHRPQIAT